MEEETLWIKISNTGPLLEAAKPQLDALRRSKSAPNSYRIGDVRRDNGCREIEIIFDRGAQATLGKLSLP